MNVPWDRRIQRARDLASQHPASSEVLNFYAHILAFQKDLFGSAVRDGVRADPTRTLRDQLAAPLIVKEFPALLALIAKSGPPGLANAARELQQQGPEQWHKLLALHAQPDSGPADQTRTFFARACLQPWAEYLASRIDTSTPGGSVCPICQSRPQLAVLRPEGEGGKRSLMCSLCLREWDFRRILCPYCGEEDHRKLPRFSAEEFPHVHVDACDTCKRYLKTVDLTINGLAVPLVDEIAAAPLDLWATEHGYEKIALNLMGL